MAWRDDAQWLQPLLTSSRKCVCNVSIQHQTCRTQLLLYRAMPDDLEGTKCSQQRRVTIQQFQAITAVLQII